MIFKVDAYDILAFIDEVKVNAPNSVVIVLNYGGELVIAHKPGKIRLRDKYVFYRPGSISATRIAKWSLYYFQSMRILFQIYLFHTSERLIFEGGDVLGICGLILRILRRTKKLFYISSDWVTMNAGRRHFSEMINVLKLYVTDFFISKYYDKLIVTTKGVLDDREKHYGTGRIKNQVLVENYWSRLLVEKAAIHKNVERKKIAYLGTIRKDFGIEEILEILPELNKKYGITVKFIGPDNHLSSHYKGMIRDLGLQGCTEWTGFVATETLPEILKDCFCGVNLQMQPDNASKRAIAGRVVNFIQFLLPSIITEYSGAIVAHVQVHRLGIITQPTANAIRKAILKAYVENQKYMQACRHFIGKARSTIGFRDLFD